MKRWYWTPGHEARVVLQINSDEEAEILRVDCSREFRGQGYATHCLKECLEDADREGVVLILVSGIGDRDGLSGEQLDEWYARLGFDAIAPGGYPGTTLMQRPPGALPWRSA